MLRTCRSGFLILFFSRVCPCVMCEDSHAHVYIYIVVAVAVIKYAYLFLAG